MWGVGAVWGVWSLGDFWKGVVTRRIGEAWRGEGV